MGKVARLPIDVEVQAQGSGLIRYAAENDDGTDFGAVAQVLPVPGSSKKGKTPVVTARDGHIHVKDAERVLVVVKLFVQGKRKTAWAELTRQLENVVMDYQTLLAAHVVEHRELFDRVKLDLGATVENHTLSNE